MPKQSELFERARALPEGFEYRLEAVSRAEEAALLETLRGLPFEEAEY